jgi:hypothetical protein
MKKTKQEVINDLKTIFPVDSKNVIVSEVNGNATFNINKQYLERSAVIEKLLRYFNGLEIIGGQCRIDNITLLFTTFYIEDRG